MEIKATKKEVKALNVILAKFTPKVWTTRVTKENAALCEKLEAFGYIEVLSRDGGYLIRLTEEGNRVKANGGFMAQFEEACRIEKEKRWYFGM
jgi:hypothetical protein